jgi:hypothetical protein
LYSFTSLPTLKYCCAECDRKFAPAEVDAGREARLCDYTGLSFCPNCHWNALAVTPARIVHNWDFDPRLSSMSLHNFYSLGLVHTRDVDLAISPSDASSIEILPSFQIAIAGDSKNVYCFLACVNTTLSSVYTMAKIALS